MPTRSDFCEGLPLACAEAVLSGLPIVTSRLSNAIGVLDRAIAEAEPESIESYVQAIRRMMEDRSTYEALSAACIELAHQFIDRSQSYPAAVDRLAEYLTKDWKKLEDLEKVFSRID